MPEQHRGLCWAEKNEIGERGRRMKERADDLYNGCIHAQVHYTNYGLYFHTAQEKLAAVCAQLRAERAVERKARHVHDARGQCTRGPQQEARYAGPSSVVQRDAVASG